LGRILWTELDQQLRRRGIKTIVIGGIATNFGVNGGYPDMRQQILKRIAKRSSVQSAGIS
jgi:nicotinamidase-related amidase